MKVSLEWAGDYVDLPAHATPERIAHDLTLKTVEVEDVQAIDGDTVLEIDNKSLTNRPDLWGHYGIARELAAIYQVPMRALPTMPRPATVTNLVGKVDSGVCARYAALRVDFDPAVARTPDLLARRLAHVGQDQVSPLVDLSNYVMFALGQPTHVFDAAALVGPLSAIPAPPQCSVDLLGGTSCDIPPGVPVITDERGVAAVAGILGGARTAFTPDTTRALIEVATFRARPVRRASQDLALRTDASRRFEKGIDTPRVDLGLDMVLYLLDQFVPGARVVAYQDATVEATPVREITVRRNFLDRAIGLRLDAAEITRTLTDLGFTTSVDEDAVQVTAPPWRSTGDVSMAHDILEEIARIHGYDRLPVLRPTVELHAPRSLAQRPLDRVVREQLATRAGLVEVVTYPWTADHLLEAVGVDKATAVCFHGAPGPDRDALRPTIVANLLEAAVGNLRHHKEFGLFEVGAVFPTKRTAPVHGVHENVPVAALQLGVVLVGADPVTLFRRAGGLVDLLRRHCHLTDLRLAPEAPDTAWADVNARATIRSHDAAVGVLALLSPRAARTAGILGANVAVLDLALDGLSRHGSRDNAFNHVPELPESDFDLSVVLADVVTWAQVETTVRDSHDMVSRVTWLDEFRGDWVDDGHRSLSLRITLQPDQDTLTAQDIRDAREHLIGTLTTTHGARLR